MPKLDSVRLLTITTPYFLYEEPVNTGQEDQEEAKTVNFETGLGLRSIEDGKRVIAFVKVTMSITNESNFCEIRTVLTFESGREEPETRDGLVVGPLTLLQKLASISVSTTRGILMQRLGNTPFQNLILPLIDTDRMVSEERKQ